MRIAASLMLLGLSACAGRGPLTVNCPEFEGFVRHVPQTELERAIHSGGDAVPAPASDLTTKLEATARARPHLLTTLGEPAAKTAVLMLSGGGQWGAYGTGYLATAHAGNALPDFTMVTGVSTGALQSLFVAIGTKAAYDRLLIAYSPEKESEIVDRGGFLRVVLTGSMAGLKPLQSRIETALCADTIIDTATPCPLDALRALKTPDGQTRLVLIGFVEAASGEFQYVDAVDLAQLPRRRARACLTGAALASAAMPVSFQQVRINDKTYYDGGVRASVFEGAVAAAAVAQARKEMPLDKQGSPDVRVPIYVVRNGPTTAEEDTEIDKDNGAILAAKRAQAILVNQNEVNSVATIRIAHPRGDLWLTSADGYRRAGCVKPKDGTMFSPDFMTCLRKLGHDDASGGRPWIPLPELSPKKQD